MLAKCSLLWSLNRDKGPVVTGQRGGAAVELNATGLTTSRSTPVKFTGGLASPNKLTSDSNFDFILIGNSCGQLASSYQGIGNTFVQWRRAPACGLITCTNRVRRQEHRELRQKGASMIHSARERKSRIRAGINFATCSAFLDLSVKQTLLTREMEIMAAAQAGSTTAFDELQRLYSPRLFRTILRITKNQEDAEDALQDAFLRAYLALRYFEARSSVYTWLTRIAINSALMILRRQRGRLEGLPLSPFGDSEDESPFEVADTALNPEQLCNQRQRSDLVLYAIQRLDPRSRTTIEIQLAGEYSLKEIADILNISVTAVKSRLYRGRARLAKRVSIDSGTKERTPFGVADKSTPASAQDREQQCTTCG